MGKLTQTTEQIQEILNKANKLPASLGQPGQVPTVNQAGTGLTYQDVIPTVAIALSQIIGQDPVQVQLTNEQYNIFANNKQVIIDLSALGYPSVVWMFETRYYEEDTDDWLIRFGAVSESPLLEYNFIDISEATMVATHMHGVRAELFKVVYNQTTFEEIQEAVLAGKYLVVGYALAIYTLVGFVPGENGYAEFGSVFTNSSGDVVYGSITVDAASSYTPNDNVTLNEQPLFKAVYGETTFLEVVAALTAGKFVVAVKDSQICVFQYFDETNGRISFMGTHTAGAQFNIYEDFWTLTSDDHWYNPYFSYMHNPMVAKGDLIVGGVGGHEERLAIGTPGQVPTVNANGDGLEYKTPSGGSSISGYNVTIALDTASGASTASGVGYGLGWLDSKMLPHGIELRYADLPYQLSDVYEITTCSVLYGITGSANYVKIATTDDIVRFASDGYNVVSLSTTNGVDAAAPHVAWYVKKNTTLSFNYVGGGGGN